MNPIIPIGAIITEKCPNCKNSVKGTAIKGGKAKFLCSVCGHAFEFSLMGRTQKKRFTPEDIQRLLDKGFSEYKP